LLLISGTDENAAVLVVAGGSFYRIQAADMTVAVKKTLPVVQKTAAIVGGNGEQNQPHAGANIDANGEADGAPLAGFDGGPAMAPIGAPEGGEMGVAPDGGVGTADGQGGGQVGRPPAGQGMPPMTPPTYLLHDNTLFLLSGSQLLAINTLTGDIQSQATLTVNQAAKHNR